MVGLVVGWWAWHRSDDAVDTRGSGIETMDTRSAGSLAAPPRPIGIAPDSPPALARGATVEGVVRLDGKAVSATVAAYVVETAPAHASLAWSEPPTPTIPTADPDAAAPTARAAAGADGRFSLAVAGPVQLLLVARDASGHEGVAWAYCQMANARADADIALSSGGASLTGRVAYADGTPFRGLIAVHAPVPSVPDGVAAGRATTDEQGRFTAHGLAPGPNVVTAFEPGKFAATSRVVPVPRDGEFVFVIDVDLHDWKGRVVDATTGFGVAAATVVAHANQGGGRSGYSTRTTSAADGSFSVRFARGYAQWIVTAPGYPELVDWRRSLDPSRPVELKLGHGHRVTGRVVRDADGTPVAGIAVFTLRSYIDRDASTVSGSDGRFVLEGLPDGLLSFAAHGGGLVSKDLLKSLKGADPLAITVGDATPEVELRVVPAGAVAGRVLDAAGRPLALASVDTFPVDRSSEAQWTYTLSSLSTAVTAADGTFRLDSMIPGMAHTIKATASDGRMGSAVAQVVAGRDAAVEVRVADGRFVEVRCATSAGTSVSSATVKALGGDGDEFDFSTDGNGIARVGPVPPGGVKLDVEAPEGYVVVGEESAVADEGAQDPVATFVLRAKRHVAGRARWSDGTPATFARIEARVAGHDDMVADIDVAGAFEFEDLAADEAQLRAFAEVGDMPIATRTVRSGDEQIEFSLPGVARPRTTIRVIGPDGAPVNGTVYVVTGEVMSDFNRQLIDGVCTTRLVEGETLMRVDPSTAAVGPATVGPVAPGSAEVVVKLPVALEVAGLVRDADGRGVKGLEVMVFPRGLPRGFQAYDERRKRATDADGRFRIGGLGAGPYELRITVPEGFDPIGVAEVEAGRTDLVYKLGPRRQANFRILDGTGSPVVNARVNSTLPSGRPVWVHSDGAGDVVVAGLDATRDETVSIEVIPPVERPDLQIFTDGRWKTTRAEIRLVAAVPIRGLVKDEAGRPLAATIKVRVGDSDPSEVLAGADGTFIVPHLAKGSVRLRASSIGPTRESQATVAAAGASDVVLILERTVSLKVVLDGLGSGGADARVGLVERGRDWERFAAADATGTATIEGVRPGTTYVVIAHAEREGEPALVGRLEGVLGTIGSVTVKLAPALSIAGRVIIPDGGRVERVDAFDGVETTSASVDKDGQFTLDALAPGRWHLVVEVLIGRWRAEADVEAGGTVTLEPKAPPEHPK